MNEPVYTISQASTLIGKKSYVLRYWEEELAIPIARNDLGHRYYTGNDIQLFLNIKELQTRGLKLLAIKDLIPKLYYQEAGSSESPIKLLPHNAPTSDDCQNHSYITSDNTSNTLEENKLLEFQTILEKLITQGLKDQKAKDREHRIHALDETIRSHQIGRRQAAATVSSKAKHEKDRKSKRSRRQT